MMDPSSEKKNDWIEMHLNKDNPTVFPFEYPDLITEYFDKRIKYYLSQKKAMLGAIYVEKNAIQNFKKEEINKTNNDLNPHRLIKDALRAYRLQPMSPDDMRETELLTGYIQWIESLDTVNEDLEVVAKEPNARKKLSDVKSLSFIDPSKMGLFIEAEKKALEGSDKFSTDIRCAAFCEMLYKEEYILQTNTRRKTMKDFAIKRYDTSIKNALATTKNVDRENHKNRKVDNQEPLRKCF